MLNKNIFIIIVTMQLLIGCAYKQFGRKTAWPNQSYYMQQKLQNSAAMGNISTSSAFAPYTR